MNNQINRYFVVPTVCSLLKTNLSQIIHRLFSHVSISRPKIMARKLLMEGLQKDIPDLEDNCPIFLLSKATKNSRGPTTDVSKFSPGFMIQMYFSFFDVESIRVFTSTFVDICYTNSYPFGFPSRSKRPPLDIFKFSRCYIE